MGMKNALLTERHRLLPGLPGVPGHMRSASGEQVGEEGGPEPPKAPAQAGNELVEPKLPAESASAQNQAPKSIGPPRFLKGKLVAMDCSLTPAAMLTVVSGAKTWKLHVRDCTHVIVIGADKFSCDWKDQKVAVNRETGEAMVEIISVEVQ
jgi:hypothetical protein